ncbi:MAG: cupredoxin domain-containing protein [Bdellovibrionales bacterium]
MKRFLFGLVALLGASTAVGKAPAQKISVEVTQAGFVPKSIIVKPGTEVVLVVTRKTDMTCSKDIQVPSRGVKKTVLPLGKPVPIVLGRLPKGEIKFGCGMDMMDSGKIIVR